mmetsp:Transcript_24425/g.63042  ORF Transcript_24425/g.63042 Transcript_24425/m.63042 type:complete len:403 (-) Transcript_24425:300-1508(-)
MIPCRGSTRCSSVPPYDRSTCASNVDTPFWMAVACVSSVPMQPPTSRRERSLTMSAAPAPLRSYRDRAAAASSPSAARFASSRDALAAIAAYSCAAAALLPRHGRVEHSRSDSGGTASWNPGTSPNLAAIELCMRVRSAFATCSCAPSNLNASTSGPAFGSVARCSPVQSAQPARRCSAVTVRCSCSRLCSVIASRISISCMPKSRPIARSPTESRTRMRGDASSSSACSACSLRFSSRDSLGAPSSPPPPSPSSGPAVMPMLSPSAAARWLRALPSFVSSGTRRAKSSSTCCAPVSTPKTRGGATRSRSHAGASTPSSGAPSSSKPPPSVPPAAAAVVHSSSSSSLASSLSRSSRATSDCMNGTSGQPNVPSGWRSDQRYLPIACVRSYETPPSADSSAPG